MEAHRYIVNVEAAVVKDGRYLTIVRGEEESHGPGVLTLPGGKVENAGNSEDILEETLRREVDEEVGIQVHDEMAYVESAAFIADDGDAVVDVVFLCQYQSGTARAADPGEVAAIHWMTAEEVLAHPRTAEWSRQSIQRVERKRIAKGW